MRRRRHSAYSSIPLRTSEGAECPKVWGLSSLKIEPATQVYALQALLK